MLLPLVWLGVFLVATMCLHLTEHGDRATQAFARCGYPPSASACIGEPGVTPDRCVAGDGAPLGEAFYLALTQTLVIGSVATTDKTRQAYDCLYGSATPTIPDWIRIWSMFHLLLSVTLITLFIQALRNHFRIR